jgi:hypothetical protein
MLSEEIAFLNSLIFYSKQNLYRPYFNGDVKEFFHEQEHEYFPFTKLASSNLLDLFVELGVEDLFKKIHFAKGEGSKLFSNFALCFLVFESDEFFERFQFSFLYDPNPFLLDKIRHLVIDKRIFGSLMKKVINMKMSKIGIFAREFFSEDYKQIFMVLKAQDSTLRQRAMVKIQN